MKSPFFEHLSDEEPKEEKKSRSPFFQHLPEETSQRRSRISAPIKGLLKGLQEQASLFSPFVSNIGRGPISEKFGKESIEKLLPVREEHEYLERLGKLAPAAALGAESIPMKLAQLAAGTAGGELAESLGLGELGQSVSEGLSMGLPGLAKGATGAIKGAFKGQTEKLPSGLTKLKAVESKFSRLGSLSKERQTRVIENLDKEASKLAKTSVEKHLPKAALLEKGIDVEGDIRHGLQNLKLSAEKANPLIDTAPISKFMRETAQKYKGIPTPHTEGRNVLKEISNFRKNPPSSLNDLLKTYRSNNAKIKNIYETAQLKGSRKEYVDFLLDQNRSISEAFEKTLPEDSAWLKQFKHLNSEYGSLRNTEKTMGQLKGILSAEPTAGQIEKLASDPRTQQKLGLSMGKEGADEVIQIAKDLKASRDVIKRMRTSEISKFDAIFPVYYLIPYIGKLAVGGKAYKLGKYGLGYLLSTSAKRRAYSSAVKALGSNDLEGYKKVVALLRKPEREQD